ncbi:MAG: hypothetical protein IPP94_13865 [Ignavibacteria bacterium]|nr:hypothetical protein [Ignavibacteria bacterium]
MTEALALWHPFIVHFAVALTMTSALLDITGFLLRSDRFDNASFVLAVLAIPALLAAVFSGNLASTFIRESRQLGILEQHETYANIAVWVFCGAGFWRVFLQTKKRYNGIRKIAYVFIVTLAAVSVFLAARKGGMIMHSTTPGALHVEPTSMVSGCMSL